MVEEFSSGVVYAICLIGCLVFLFYLERRNAER